VIFTTKTQRKGQEANDRFFSAFFFCIRSQAPGWERICRKLCFASAGDLDPVARNTNQSFRDHQKRNPTPNSRSRKTAGSELMP
jgi:hypothetical protein